MTFTVVFSEAAAQDLEGFVAQLKNGTS